MHNEPFVTLADITVRLRDKAYLRHTSWRVSANEHWAVLGPNGAGKSTLVRALMGEVPVIDGRIIYHFLGDRDATASEAAETIGYVGPELHRAILEREAMAHRLRDFSGQTDGYTSVGHILENAVPYHPTTGARRPFPPSEVQDIARRTGIATLLARPVESVSAGEMRKTLIARALIRRPRLLILDEPFDGLDAASRQSLGGLINELMNGALRLILITHRFEDIVANVTHVLYLKDGQVTHQGDKGRLLNPETLQEVFGLEARPPQKPPRIEALTTQALTPSPEAEKAADARGPALVEMKNVTVRYGAVRALNDFTWRMMPGENWALLGPNGAGKSTVIKLILGENTQGYANEIYLFGNRKGSGESVWDIRRQIGIVSTELQANYRRNISVLDIICSGFHDSIGLYRHCTAEQRRDAREWLRKLELDPLVDCGFERLSYGQRQMILIARAMVKAPALLILDEPCEGLDIANRRKILHIIDYIGSQTATSLLYVTHHTQELVPCMTHMLKLNRGKVRHVESLRPGRPERLQVALPVSGEPFP